MNNIDEIKNQLDIVDVISESVKLRRSGKNYTGFCPFHANTRTPAFVVFPDTGTWRCFGECNEGGDIFRYVMKKDGLDFREALKILADRAGIQLEPLTPQKKEQNEREGYLRKILDEAVVFYRHQLLNTSEGNNARAYLRDKRGINPQTEEVWELGYAPNSWDSVLKHFQAKGYKAKDLIDAGLLSEKDDGKVYDRFRHRIMFPIRNMSGKMTGFGGRVLNSEDIPKFINSSQTILFDKSAIMYGLDKARRAIRTENQVVIVEGYFDVIVVHQEGFQNVVSPMGTAITETQMRLLKRFTRRFVMALDPDAAGQKATLRGLEVARDALEHDTDPVFDARGLLHHESRLKADLRVSTLPEDLDPDEIVLRNPSDWEEIVHSARPIIYHVLDSLLINKDINDPKVKSTIVAQILPLVKDISNPIERDAYRQYIARTLKVDESTVLATTVSSKRKRYRRKKTPTQEKVHKPTTVYTFQEHEKINRIEREILSYLAKSPESKYRIDRFLRTNELDQVSVDDFSNTENQQIATIVFSSLSQDEMDPIDFISANLVSAAALSGNESSLFSESFINLENSETRQLEETARQVMQLRQILVNQEIKNFRFLQSNSLESESDENTDLINKRLPLLIKKRALLDRALAKPVTIE